MKKTFKKVISVLLVAVMVFGSAPLAGLVGIEFPEFNLFGTKAEATTYNGTCGYNLTWTLDTETGVLEINGSGAMENYYSSSSVPWYNYQSSIKTITIGNSVTSIGRDAFYKCTGLTSVTIPDGVTSIGDDAFYNCSGLTSVTIGNGVTSIGGGAFYNTGIYNDSSNWENGVLYIGNYLIEAKTTISGDYTIKMGTKVIAVDAFYNCTKLTSITIPDGVTSIGQYAFSSCTKLTSITIPDSVTSIGINSFRDCTGLTSVTIGNGVTSIGDYAFSSCTGLTSVTIPDSVTNIGYEAFYNTGIYNDSSNWENDVLYIGNYLIKAETIISGDYTIKTGTKVIAASAFYNCTKLTSVTIPDSVTSIGDNAFYYFTGLTIYYTGTPEQWRDISIGSNNYPINRNIIFECNSERPWFDKGICGDNLTWILYSDGELVIDGTGDMTDYSGGSSVPWYSKRSKIKSATIGNNVTSIGGYAFYDCDGLTSVTIPNSVTSIGYCAFYGCTGLTNVTIGNSVTSIGEDAFYNTGIYNDSSNWENDVLYIGNYLIKTKTTISGDYTIKTGTKVIAVVAFYNCTKLTSVTIPDSVTSIGSNSFRDCTGLTSVTIPDSVTSIGSVAFGDCTGLTSVTIGNGVTNIGGSAFSGCTGLTSITIPDGVTSIGDYAFSSCTGLTSITIPDSVTSIGDYAFSSCTGLTSITIPDGVTSIGRYAFYKCTGLTSITIPDSVTSIGNCAFSGCNNIATTYYTGTPEQWRDISIGSNNYQINRNIIFECNSERAYYGKGTCGENLTWTLYTDGELVIDGTGDMTDYSGGSNAPWYSKSSKIKSATIGNNVTSIGGYAFYDCDGLTSVTIPNSVTSIGDYAFSSCTGLTSITIPDSVTNIGDYAFYGCTNLEKIGISAYSVEIADNLFDKSPKVILYCKSGSTVQSYAELNDIMYILIDGPASGFAVKNNQLVAYKGESENPQIPSGVTSIGANSFKDNGTVKTVELPNSVSSIFSGAFSNCSSLERIVVPHTVTTIAPDAFNGTNATIVCYANSYAHQYAVEKGMSFELISITLNQTKVILSVGEYSIITATPEQEYLDSVQTSWKSSDTGVATVDANGKVTALSNGTATIYALAPTGETLATCSVQVGYSFRITIQNPSTKTISYKSGIILHATADNLPAGAKIVWEKDNDNFSMSDYGNGNCKIVSKANGSTTFTAKIKLADGSIAKDSKGNEISAQVTMNSKAGFFDKIVAFFKGLFGRNKVLPQFFKGIF